MGRKLATNTTVEGTTYPAGTEVPAEVEALIDNPKAWGVEEPRPGADEDGFGGDAPEPAVSPDFGPIGSVVDAGNPLGASDDDDDDLDDE